MNTLMKLAMKLHLLKCASVATDKGVLNYQHDGELVVGDEVFIEKTEGEDVEFVPAEDGEYKVGDVTIKVADGKVASIDKPTVDTVKPLEAEVDTDKPADVDDNQKPAEPSAEERIQLLEEGLQSLREAIESKDATITDLTERLATLESKIADLEKPADDPADKEKTDLSKQDRLAGWKSLVK